VTHQQPSIKKRCWLVVARLAAIAPIGEKKKKEKKKNVRDT
jgi:hypothetical protein